MLESKNGVLGVLGGISSTEIEVSCFAIFGIQMSESPADMATPITYSLCQ